MKTTYNKKKKELSITIPLDIMFDGVVTIIENYEGVHLEIETRFGLSIEGLPVSKELANQLNNDLRDKLTSSDQ